jgi:hypothetical protein
MSNLPASPGESISCYASGTQIVCENIGGTIQSFTQYFVSAKIGFNYNQTQQISNFGQVTMYITLNGVQYSSAIPFFGSEGSPVNLQNNTEYLDTTGWH